MTRVAEWVQTFLVVGLIGSFVALLWVAGSTLKPPPPPDGLRHEPEPFPGARVQTEYGPGTVVGWYREWTGRRWVVRLDSGRRVALYRAEMVVLP